MRLGSHISILKHGSLAKSIYKTNKISERHRHRYEVNNYYIKLLQKYGLIVSGKSYENTLVEIIEITSHPWFIACQFHPEFISNPRKGHPIFKSFLHACIKKKIK